MQETADVLIVGAGPTGLSLALTLDKLGVSFQIIDQKEKTEISLENVRSLISRYPRLPTYPED